AALVWLSAPSPAFAGASVGGKKSDFEVKDKRMTGFAPSKQGKKPSQKPRPDLPDRVTQQPEKKVTGLERLHWILLAFVPSSLMLGVTTYMTTDIASIPFLWVLPLGLYLLSFILVFSRLPESVHRSMVVALPLVVLLLMFVMMTNLEKIPMWGKLGLHL